MDDIRDGGLTVGLKRDIKKQTKDAKKFAEDNPPEVAVFDSAETDQSKQFKRRMAMLSKTRGGAGTLSGPMAGVTGDSSVLRGLGIG